MASTETTAMDTPRKKIALVLSDGSLYQGELIGSLAQNGKIGEIVFNTSMSGYQEIITDPSYRGQMVCFTYPSIGNYGINAEDNQSDHPWLEGIIMRDYCPTPSNFRSTMTLEEYLLQNNLPGISGIDTRSLVRHIRSHGSLMGGLFYCPEQGQDKTIWLKEKLQAIHSAPDMEGLNLTDVFDGKAGNAYVQRYLQKNQKNPDGWKKIAVLDFGIKFAILDNFLKRNILPTVFPGNTPLEQWEGFNAAEYDGFFFSNGPGDPAAVTTGVENISKIQELTRPMFGICLGHQMLSLSLGAKTYKLKFGHHGGNQPVRAAHRRNVLITAQNHGFAVDEDSLRAVEPSVANQFEFNPNDSTAEGYFLTRGGSRILSIQYHPEASPGPHDAQIVFDEFAEMLR